MFRRFIDLSLSEVVPDHSTIWRFRQLLNTENLLEPLLEQINHHLGPRQSRVFLCQSRQSDHA
jgi:IS5 family transposase